MIRPTSQGSNESETEQLLFDNNTSMSGNYARPPAGNNNNNRYLDQDDIREEDSRKGHPPTPIYVKNQNSVSSNAAPISEEGNSRRWGRQICFPNTRNPSVHDGDGDENQAQRTFFAPAGGVHYSYVIVMALFFSTIVQLSRGGLLAYEQKKHAAHGDDIHPNYAHGFNNIRGSNTQTGYYGNWGNGKNGMGNGAQNQAMGTNMMMNSNMMNNGGNNNFAQNNNNMMNNGGNNMMAQQQPSMQSQQQQAWMGNNMMQANAANDQSQFQQQSNGQQQRGGYAMGNGNNNVAGVMSTSPGSQADSTTSSGGYMNTGTLSGSGTADTGDVNPASTSGSMMSSSQQQQPQYTSNAVAGGVSDSMATQAATGSMVDNSVMAAGQATAQGVSTMSDGSLSAAQPATTVTPGSMSAVAQAMPGDVPVAGAVPIAGAVPVAGAVPIAGAVPAGASGSLTSGSSATAVAPVDSGIVAAIDPNDTLPELSNFKDSWDPWEPTDMPVFFHIPKSGGSTIKDVMGTCHRFVLASEAGVTDGHIEDTEIAIVYPRVGVPGASLSPFVNIDATTVAGIQRASALGFADSGLGDTVVTPFLYEANELFTKSAKGRLFTVFRHPIDRAISLFYYLQVADWEPTYDPALIDWTIEQYAVSDKIENNWLTRQLSNQLSGDLEDVHVQKAMEVIRRKFLVGLMTEMEKTMTRLERYFRWTYHVNPENQEKCRVDLLSGGSNSNSKNKPKKSKPKEGDEAWELLAAQNQFDLQVWGYIESLFAEQEQYVADIPEDMRNVGGTCCKCSPPTIPPEGFECPAAITEE